MVGLLDQRRSSRQNDQMRAKVQRLLAALSHRLYERDEAIRLALLATLARESIFFLGPPGVGKSLIARRIRQAVAEATSFEYLMGRFSTPDEVFGPLSISQLRNADSYERKVEHYLPDAHIVFLDEIWKASAPIQNALLTALNERLYRNGTREMQLPMQVFIGASNDLPEREEATEAFWDRFLIRTILTPIKSEADFASLLQDGSELSDDPVPDDVRLTLGELSEARERAAEIKIDDTVRGALTLLRRWLAERDNPGLYVSDRRWKKIAKLLRMSATMHDRKSVSIQDLAIVRYCTWSALDVYSEAQELCRQMLRSCGSLLVPPAAQLEGSLEELRAFAHELTVRHETTDAHAPVIYRGEYVRLLGAPHAPLVLVWHTDLEAMAVGSSGEIELFGYSDERFERSSVVHVERVGVHELRIGETSYEIETETASSTVAEQREPSAAERNRWRARLDSVRGEIDRRIAELTQHAAAHAEDAAAHLMIAQQDTEAITEGFSAAIDEHNDLRIALAELESDYPVLT